MASYIRPLPLSQKAVNDFVPANDWNKQVVDDHNWALNTIAGTNDSDSINQAAVQTLPSGSFNMLCNPSFEIWQRSTSVDNSANALGTTIYATGADGWYTQGATITSREPSNVYSGSYSLKSANAGVGTVIGQSPTDPAQFGGFTYMAFSAWINGTATAHVGIQQGTANSAISPTTITNSGWQYVSAYAPITDTSFIEFYISVDSPGDLYIDGCMLSATPGPVPFQPLNMAEEWWRVDYRYQIIRAVYSNYLTINQPDTITVPLRRTMVRPTPFPPNPASGVANNPDVNVNYTNSSLLCLADSWVFTFYSNTTGAMSYDHTFIVDAGVY